MFGRVCLRSVVTAFATLLLFCSKTFANPLFTPIKKHSPPPLKQVEKLSVPPQPQKSLFTEVAVTLSFLNPEGDAGVVNQKPYNLNQLGTLPVLSAQFQHWAMQDLDSQQKLGLLFGTGFSDKSAKVELPGESSLTKVDVVYLHLFGGLSWEQSLLDDRLALGLSGLVSQELWQQNNQTLKSDWSRWLSSLELVVSGKWNFSEQWYALTEFHHRLPLQEPQKINSQLQRLNFGFGYSLGY